MIVYIKHTLLHLTLILIPTILFSQQADTSIVTVDNSTGIKKVTYRKFIGSGGSFAGNSPRLTKTTITKYDKNGKIIYQSHRTFRLRGCIGDTPQWDIIAYDSSGGHKTLKLERKTKIIVKSFDKNGKLTTQTKTSFFKFSHEEWEDKDEGK